MTIKNMYIVCYKRDRKIGYVTINIFVNYIVELEEYIS